MPRHSRPDSSAAVLLAAGQSSRMGEHKLLLDLGGEPVARFALRSLAETVGIDAIVVVLGREAARVREALAGFGATFVVNEDYESGIASSFRAGAEALTGVDAVLFALADQPLVAREHFGALVARALADRPAVVATRSDGIVMPPFVARGAALAAVREHGLGVRKLLERHEGDARFVDLAAAAVADVDEPADLERLRALLALS
jgi:molybdenum cofactor cytidylyltransferase